VALAERWMAEFVAEQEGAVGERDGRDALVAIGVAYVHYAHEHPSRFVTIFDPAMNRARAPVTPVFAQSVARHTELLRHTVGRAVQTGALPATDTALTAEALWAQVHGLATLVMLGHLPVARTTAVLGALLRT
jgi:AcrR family transcriptional regulator